MVVHHEDVVPVVAQQVLRQGLWWEWGMCETGAGGRVRGTCIRGVTVVGWIRTAWPYHRMGTSTQSKAMLMFFKSACCDCKIQVLFQDSSTYCWQELGDSLAPLHH
jgi:hypothetical protein